MVLDLLETGKGMDTLVYIQEEEGFRRSSELEVVVNILWYLSEMTSNLVLLAFTSYGTDTAE